MKVLLLGKDGQVGFDTALSLYPFADVTALGRDQFDALTLDSIPEILERYKPDIVINAIAYTAVDKAEEEVDLCRKINAIFPGQLASCMSRLKKQPLLIHLSTDYVFDGKNSLPYPEDFKTNPLIIYGQTKLEGEMFIKSAYPRHLIFRLSGVYSGRRSNFVLTMLKLMKSRKTLKLVNDQKTSPTWSRIIGSALGTVVYRIKNRGLEGVHFGAYHLSALGEISWYDFTKNILEFAPENIISAKRKEAINILPISSKQFGSKAKRPTYSILSGQKLSWTFNLQIPNWQIGLKEFLNELSCKDPF